MAYELIEGDPEPGSVRRLTFVPFLPDGECAALPGPALPSGTVRDGEHWLLDATLRIPLETRSSLAKTRNVRLSLGHSVGL